MIIRAQQCHKISYLFALHSYCYNVCIKNGYRPFFIWVHSQTIQHRYKYQSKRRRKNLDKNTFDGTNLPEPFKSMLQNMDPQAIQQMLANMDPNTLSMLMNSAMGMVKEQMAQNKETDMENLLQNLMQFISSK